MSTTTGEAGWLRPRQLTRRRAVDFERVMRAAPLTTLLALTAGLYLIGLARNGWANQYYSAAVQAGAHSWKAFLFGSLDASNYITVDKPPASLWLMELSSRLFGFSSFSMLLPQALEGIAAVAVLYATIRRWFGSPAALLAGLILAITPVAALMFRFNNPDALLVLLFVLAAYFVTRALEDGKTRWIVLASSALGFAFLTKMLQAFVVLPAFALVYLVAAPVALRRRLWQLLLGGVVLVVSAGWWVALVELWPAAARPYIGGSTNNDVLQLILGYNGLDRISSGGGPGGGFSGTAGILRLFNSQLGGQISWLLPAALIALVVGAAWSTRRWLVDVGAAWSTRRWLVDRARADRPHTDRVPTDPTRAHQTPTGRTRAALVLWGGWLVVTGAVYSFMSGIIHPYYTNTLAPAIAALVGVGVVLLWQRRSQLAARLTLATIVAATAAWAFALLDRTPDWHPWLRFGILALAVVAGGGLVAIGMVGPRVRRTALVVLAASGLASALAAPAAYTLNTIETAQAGQNVTAGPAVASADGFGGRGFGGPGFGGRGFPGRGFGGRGFGGRGFGGRGFPGAPAGARPGIGGGGSSVSHALVSLLARSSSHYKWIAASTSWETAASIQLASGKPVMAIGGFSGSDGMTLARFQQLVAQKKIHYYVAGGGGGGRPSGIASLAGGRPPENSGATGAMTFRGGPGGGVTGRGGPGGFETASKIQSWVAAHFKAYTIGGTTVYDLTQPKAGS